jgi:hypothetical protein
MSIEAVHRARRYEPPAEDEATAKAPTAARPLRQPHELETPIGYPHELFAVRRQPTDEKTPLVLEPRTRAANGATVGGATIHTSSPHDIGVRTTTSPPREVVALIRKHWPQLTEAGARTLAAQWAGETNFGKNCFSFNFGNVKCVDTKQDHMYLARIWEVAHSDADAARMRAAGGYEADDRFKRDLGLPLTMRVIRFDPPHPTTRFRAFKSADEGMAFWVAYKQKIAVQHPEYVDALNRGDVAAVAHVLAKAKYATAPEPLYRDAMIRCRKTIDGLLGGAS